MGIILDHYPQCNSSVRPDKNKAMQVIRVFSHEYALRMHGFDLKSRSSLSVLKRNCYSWLRLPSLAKFYFLALMPAAYLPIASPAGEATARCCSAIVSSYIHTAIWQTR